MYPEEAEEQGLIQLLNDMLLEDFMVAKRKENELTGSYDFQKAKTMFQPCQNDTFNRSECRFILLLSGIGNLMRLQSDYSYMGVRAYITNRTMAQQDFTLQDLEDYVEDFYGNVVDDKMHFPRYDFDFVVFYEIGDF